ncbi:P protein-like [Coccinella septempunctata]|uniref:P protein-like n=1 Tax=Coccinella septempunctata TaxID=41139 RepID=UPI001D098DC0|nr:P protein-like [Coccinella septempunctata]
MTSNETTLCQHITIAVLPPTCFSPNCSKSVNSVEQQDEVFSEKSGDSVKSSIKNKLSLKCSTFKYIVYFLMWLGCCFLLTTSRESFHPIHQLSIQKSITTEYIINDSPKDGRIKLIVGGAFLPAYYANLSTRWVNVHVQLIETFGCPMEDRVLTPSKVKNIENVTEVWKIPTVTESLIGIVPEISARKLFLLNATTLAKAKNYLLQICLSTNLNENLPISLGFNTEPIDPDAGVVFAGMVLVALYIVIIFELLHRTVAAIFACIVSLSILAAFNAKPSIAEIVSWISMDTIMLLFSMMILVTVISETGIFDYMAVQTYKFTGGKVWPLVNILCVVAVFFACFLDNVTTALLITPVTIRLSEVMKLNPVPVLMCMVMLSNIGGAITPLGDPPNVIIASNPDVLKAGVNFMSFTLHMGLGTSICFMVTYAYLRYYYRNVRNFRHPEPPEVQQLKSKIAVWRRTTASVSSYSRDESFVREKMKRRTAKLVGRLKSLNNITITEEEFCSNLEDLKKQYPIKDMCLLIKSGGTMLLVIIALLLQSVPSWNTLGMAWTALLGAVLVILLYDKDDVVGIFTRIEWSTLLYFAALFILMEALSKLGLIDSIGKQTERIINSVVPEYRLTVSIVLILWVSGLASAFVDNLPLTTMMIKIVTNLSSDPQLNLPFQPLVWALSFGACLGGNGSLFGSSSNIICAGVAEQHGYKFGFTEFSKVGIPIVILTLMVTTLYLIICHVVLQWNS